MEHLPPGRKYTVTGPNWDGQYAILLGMYDGNKTPSCHESRRQSGWDEVETRNLLSQLMVMRENPEEVTDRIRELYGHELANCRMELAAELVCYARDQACGFAMTEIHRDQAAAIENIREKVSEVDYCEYGLFQQVQDEIFMFLAGYYRSFRTAGF